MYTDNLATMIGKEVVVTASGMIYRGRLVEVSETEVFLQGQLGWIQLRVEDVTEIKPAG
ncbi:MAG TPA: hypothetical protein VJM83_02530 [Nitrospirota bacterium]|nr:hypothetical protein [Nitrospirota bacterium]